MILYMDVSLPTKLRINVTLCVNTCVCTEKPDTLTEFLQRAINVQNDKQIE
jgi:dissimilatory sulfite reductase (desulfoviridin) alpha/beta subunit